MFKKYAFLLILVLCTNILAMEEQEKGKEKEEKFLKLRLDFLESNVKTESRRNSGEQSPRSILNINCLLLNLPDEILSLIIFHLLEPIDLDQLNKNDRTDLLHLKEIYKLVAPFGLSCITISALIPEGICDFYLIKLGKYPRLKKIQLAQDSYTNGHFSSFAFLLTSLLKAAKCKDLYSKSNFLKKLISTELLHIENSSLKFILSADDADNLQLMDILLELQSNEDNLVSLDTIFQIVLTSLDNRSVLKYLIDSDENCIPNGYITNYLMQRSFNGDLDEFRHAAENNTEEIYSETARQFNAVIWAIIGGSSDLLEYIFNCLPLEDLARPNKLNQNLIHFGALYATPETLQYLLNYISEDSVVNLKDCDNKSPLYRAIQSGSEHKTLILINNGATLGTLIECDFPPYNGASEMLRQLIENKSIFLKIAEELGKSRLEKGLSPKDVIKCCTKCKKDKSSLITFVCILGTGAACLITYGEVFLSVFT